MDTNYEFWNFKHKAIMIFYLDTVYDKCTRKIYYELSKHAYYYAIYFWM